MKTPTLPISTFIFALVLLGCQSTSTPLTEVEMQEIRNEVRQSFKRTTEAVNNHDAVKIMESCWNDENYLYAANGTLTKGWDKNNDISTTIHSDPKNQLFTIEYDEISIRVLKRDAVLLVGKGYFHNILTKDGTKSVDLIVTFLMEKVNGKWVITIGHESYPEAILIF